jgi:hypothetical protein
MEQLSRVHGCIIDPALKRLKPFALSLSKGQSFGSFDKLSPNGVETSWGRINRACHPRLLDSGNPCRNDNLLLI